LLTYTDFARALYDTGILDDAWRDGQPRFRLQGIVLSRARAEALRRAAERVGAVYQELITLVWNHPAWLDDYFCLTPYQKLMWFAPRAVGTALPGPISFCAQTVVCCAVK
jgi:hypothetical protein